VTAGAAKGGDAEAKDVVDDSMPRAAMLQPRRRFEGKLRHHSIFLSLPKDPN
jgi:hypothetical protein